MFVFNSPYHLVQGYCFKYIGENKMYRSKNTIRRSPEPFKHLFNTNTKAWKYYCDLIRTLYYNERSQG